MHIADRVLRVGDWIAVFGFARDGGTPVGKIVSVDGLIFLVSFRAGAIAEFPELWLDVHDANTKWARVWHDVDRLNELLVGDTLEVTYTDLGKQQIELYVRVHDDTEVETGAHLPYRIARIEFTPCCNYEPELCGVDHQWLASFGFVARPNVPGYTTRKETP